MKIYRLVYGESFLPENNVFIGGNKNKNIPITFSIYLVEIGEQKILIDAGCDTMPGFEMRKYFSPAFVLRTVGLSADKITDVIITHAHHDHIEAVKHFKNAIIHIQKDEYEARKHYIPSGFKLNIFKDTTIVANKLEIIKIGGHSKGSCIVKCDDFVFVGDEYYVKDCLRLKIPTGSTVDIEKSKKFIEKYSNDKYINLLFHDKSLKTERII